MTRRHVIPAGFARALARPGEAGRSATMRNVPSGDIDLAQVDPVVQRQQRGDFLDHGLLLGAPSFGRIVERYAILPVVEGKSLFDQPQCVGRARTLSAQVIHPLLDNPRRYQSVEIAHGVAVGQRRRQYQSSAEALDIPVDHAAAQPQERGRNGIDTRAKSRRNISGARP
jgi:hypothetical protein